VTAAPTVFLLEITKNELGPFLGKPVPQQPLHQREEQEPAAHDRSSNRSRPRDMRRMVRYA